MRTGWWQADRTRWWRRSREFRGFDPVNNLDEFRLVMGVKDVSQAQKPLEMLLLRRCAEPSGRPPSSEVDRSDEGSKGNRTDTRLQRDDASGSKRAAAQLDAQRPSVRTCRAVF